VTILAIKTVHTVIFVLMSACIGYLLFARFSGRRDGLLVVAVAAIALEGLALALNRGRCPLTTLAESCGAEHGQVTDIFCPAAIEPHIFRVSAVLVTVGLGAVLVGWVGES
jgi:hypothetical protein